MVPANVACWHTSSWLLAVLGKRAPVCELHMACRTLDSHRKRLSKRGLKKNTGQLRTYFWACCDPGCFADAAAAPPSIMPGARCRLSRCPCRRPCVQAKVGKFRFHEHAQKGEKAGDECGRPSQFEQVWGAVQHQGPCKHFARRSTSAAHA